MSWNPQYGVPDRYAFKPPTDVVGRRIGAYLLDGVISLIVGAVMVVSLLHHTTGNPPRTCLDRGNANAGYMCIQLGGDVYSVEQHDAWKIFAVGAGRLFLLDVLLQGLTGGTIGKLIVGIRVVDAEGRICGPWRAFMRSLPWAVGLLTYAFGNQGASVLFSWLGSAFVVAELVALLSRKQHRRFGDTAAGTFVIDKHFVGQPVPDVPVVYGNPYGGGWGPGGSQLPQHAPTESLPQWDQARDTYIWWDAEQGEWLEHDRASGEWRPISR